MTDTPKIEWDKLPVIVETAGFRKTTDDFTFTIVTARRYEDHAKSFMSRLSSMGVLFFVPCITADQVDALLQEHTAPPSVTDGEAPAEVADLCLVPVEVMARVLGVDPRTVQLDVERGMLVRNAHGMYDALASCGTLRKAWKDAENAVTEDHKKEKGLILREQRIKLEAANKERLGQLMNAEKTRQAIEHIEAEERQALLNMPKTLGPQCDMLPGREVEIKLMDWVRRHLKEQSAWDRIISLVRAALSSSVIQQGKKEKKLSRAKTQRAKRKP